MIKGIIFDYGGTIDSRGVHWSWVIWDGYQAAGVDISLEQFREAYVMAERELAKVRHILPNDNFHDLLVKKMDIEFGYLAEQGILEAEYAMGKAKEVAQYCYERTRQCIEEARPVLEALSQKYPMMLVSNFYGNVDSVLRDFDVRRYFKGIIESAVVGIRKPNPTLFRLGVDALEMPAEEVMVIGDSLTKDILPAESIGCKTLWLKARGWTDKEDDTIRPDIIDALADVLKQL
ncbi:MAG: HAD family hydrolase [Bacteroidales bacterium]|nr:HAD family hydrolase [Bacteroidales bacterium]